MFHFIHNNPAHSSQFTDQTWLHVCSSAAAHTRTRGRLLQRVSVYYIRAAQKGAAYVQTTASSFLNLISRWARAELWKTL